MKNSIRRSPSARKANPASKAALGRYLAAGLGATGLASVECEAAIVNIDITNIGSNNQNISGPNAGMPAGTDGQLSFKTVFNFPVAGQHTGGSPTSMFFSNQLYEGPYYSTFFTGVRPGRAVQFATGGTFASPFRFTEAGTNLVGPSLPEGAEWTADNSTSGGTDGDFSLFRVFNGSYYYYNPVATAPDWGAGSYIGFRARPTDTSTDWTYGYFEMTWTNSTNTFEVLSGAYESTPNTAIAVQAVQPVPEPSAIALAGIGALALGAGAIRRSRKARKAAVGGSLA